MKRIVTLVAVTLAFAASNVSAADDGFPAKGATPSQARVICKARVDALKAQRDLTSAMYVEQLKWCITYAQLDSKARAVERELLVAEGKRLDEEQEKLKAEQEQLKAEREASQREAENARARVAALREEARRNREEAAKAQERDALGMIGLCALGGKSLDVACGRAPEVNCTTSYSGSVANTRCR